MDKTMQNLMFSSKNTEWSTPADFFRRLDEKYNYLQIPRRSSDEKLPIVQDKRSTTVSSRIIIYSICCKTTIVLYIFIAS